MREQDSFDWLEAPPAMLHRLLLLALLMTPPGVLGWLMVVQHTPATAPGLAESVPVNGATNRLVAASLSDNPADTRASDDTDVFGRNDRFDEVAAPKSQGHNPLMSRAHGWQGQGHGGYDAHAQVMPQE